MIFEVRWRNERINKTPETTFRQKRFTIDRRSVKNLQQRKKNLETYSDNILKNQQKEEVQTFE